MTRAHVPKERQTALTKPEIAIEEIDRVIASGGKRKPTPTFRRGFELSRLRVVVGEAVGDGWERGLL